MDMFELKRFVVAYEELRKISKRLRHLDLASCNYGLTPRQETRVENLKREAANYAASLGYTSYHQGDPRGWPLYLVPDDGKDHDRDYSNGIAIPPF